ncbi:unnamed protein product, partial [Polarella glacialis]
MLEAAPSASMRAAQQLGGQDLWNAGWAFSTSLRFDRPLLDVASGGSQSWPAAQDLNLEVWPMPPGLPQPWHRAASLRSVRLRQARQPVPGSPAPRRQPTLRGSSRQPGAGTRLRQQQPAPGA